MIKWEVKMSHAVFFKELQLERNLSTRCQKFQNFLNFHSYGNLRVITPGLYILK